MGYYDLIPHTDKIEINSLSIMKERLKILESLSNIACGASISESANKTAMSQGLNKLDTSYHQLNCKLTPLARCTAAYDIIEQFARSTFARVHKSEFRVSIVDVLEVQKENELQQFESIKHQLGNCHLLW